EKMIAGPREKRRVPLDPPGVIRVVAEEVRFLGPAHEQPALTHQLLMQRRRGALHGADDDEIGQASMLHQFRGFSPRKPRHRAPQGVGSGGAFRGFSRSLSMRVAKKKNPGVSRRAG